LFGFLSILPSIYVLFKTKFGKIQRKNINTYRTFPLLFIEQSPLILNSLSSTKQQQNINQPHKNKTLTTEGSGEPTPPRLPSGQLNIQT
jgi:hypothetical protein